MADGSVVEIERRTVTCRWCGETQDVPVYDIAGGPNRCPVCRALWFPVLSITDDMVGSFDLWMNPDLSLYFEYTDKSDGGATRLTLSAELLTKSAAVETSPDGAPRGKRTRNG